MIQKIFVPGFILLAAIVLASSLATDPRPLQENNIISEHGVRPPVLRVGEAINFITKLSVF